MAELPYNYEDRVRKVRGLDLERLTVLVPDKYDLALSKALRGYPHDIDAIEGMHRKHRLSQKTLVDRFETELAKIATADERIIRLNVAMVVARLFERGSYHLSDATLRYRRGASGRQPLTPEVWSVATGWRLSGQRLGVAFTPARTAGSTWSGFLAWLAPD